MHARAALWGDALTPREPGPVALVSQSGNVAVNALATRRGLRFHTVIASGNQAVLGAADYLSFLATATGRRRDRAVPRGRRRPAAVRRAGGVRARPASPVVVLKVGSSPAGARAAAAHSAALAGDQRIFRALIEEAGGVWAADVHELLELAKALAVRPAARPARRRQRGLAIMTCSGGDSAQGADEAARLGLELPALAPATCERLRALLPSRRHRRQPARLHRDDLGRARPLLSELVRTLGEDPAIDQVLVFYDQFPGLTRRGVGGLGRGPRGDHRRRPRRAPAPTMICSTLPELLDDDAAWRLRPGRDSGRRRAAHRAGVRRRRMRAAARRSGPAARDRDTARRVRTIRVSVQGGVAVRARRQGAAARPAASRWSTAGWSPTPHDAVAALANSAGTSRSS